jgi:hypothetical protein
MSPPSPGSKKSQAKNQRESRWQDGRRHVPPKRRLTFNGLYGVISLKTEVFIGLYGLLTLKIPYTFNININITIDDLI